jgi:L-threonylcarbamoyladenylate synthase
MLGNLPARNSVRIVAVDPTVPDPGVLTDAAAVVLRGGLVAFPTESFYGLGADALDPAAVERIFRAKARPESKPLLVLVSSIAMAETITTEIPEAVRDLMDRHWPGPVTLVLPAAARVPAGVTAGTGTVGLRLPAHSVARGLVKAVGRPVTAPSANPSGAEPAVTAQDVIAYFGDAVDVVLDGGKTAGGPGSTVADCTVWPPRIIRQGPVRL